MAYANCSFLPRLASQPNRSPKFCLSEEQQTLKLCYEFMTPSTAFLPHHLRRKMLVAVAAVQWPSPPCQGPLFSCISLSFFFSCVDSCEFGFMLTDLFPFAPFPCSYTFTSWENGRCLILFSLGKSFTTLYLFYKWLYVGSIMSSLLTWKCKASTFSYLSEWENLQQVLDHVY